MADDGRNSLGNNHPNNQGHDEQQIFRSNSMGNLNVNRGLNAGQNNAVPQNVGQQNAGPVNAVPQNLGQVNEEHQNAVPVNAGAGALINARSFRQAPVVRRTVDMKQRAAEIQLPTEEILARTYSETQFESIDSAWKRSKKLKECKDRFYLQAELDNAFRTHNRPEQNNVTMEKAVKLSDQDLIKKYRQYYNGNEYLRARYDLIENKYYSVLSQKEVRGLKRAALIQRIKSLYEVQGERNDELIRFYQATVLVMDAEERQKEKPEEANNKVHALPGQATLKKQNDDAVKRNRKVLDAAPYSEEEYTARKTMMESVLIPENKASSWKGADNTVDDNKKEALREVLAWMYRNCNKSSISKEPFVYKLANARTDQLLFMFYLVENEKVDGASEGEFYKAMTDYVPDLDRFKKKVVASRFNVFKRMHTDKSDEVIDWDILGNASRFVFGCEVLDDHINVANQIKEATQEIRQQHTGEEKRDLLYELIHAKGVLLLNMYRAAGLTPDMPPALIKDQKLREKVERTLEEFEKDSKMLVVLINRHGLGEGEAAANALQYDEAEAAKSGIKGSGKDLDEIDTKTKIVKTINLVTSPDKLKNDLGSKVKAFSKTTGYAASVGALTGVVSIIGLIGAIKGAHALRIGSSKLTAADHVAKSLSVSSGMLSSTNGIVSAGSGILGKFVNLGTPAASKGLFTLQTAKQSFNTISGGLKFCAGAVNIVAGGLQTAGASVQLRRYKSSQDDVQRSRDALDNKQGELTEDQQQLRRFLDHQDRSLKDKKFSATLNVISGSVKMLAGAATMSGILLPVGAALSVASVLMDIGLGVLYARRRKRLTHLQAVDEGLKIEEKMTAMLAREDRIGQKANAMKKDKLREYLRQEELGKLSYSTYKEFYSDLCKKNAMLLYSHVFGPNASQDPDYEMYLDALKSIGTKVVVPGPNMNGNPFPTPEVIYSKLME
ncbi:MAG: hypothetical protein K6G03_11785 [Lachnospiraceae bacterium]|nr:hypothetical protein [Lachnospiraceae bacterium]